MNDCILLIYWKQNSQNSKNQISQEEKSSFDKKQIRNHA